MDKGFYDYDYEAPKAIVRIKTYDESVKSDEEIRDILSRFGWQGAQDEPRLTAERIQAELMDETRNNQ